MLTCRKVTAQSWCHRLWVTAQCPYDFMGPARPSCGNHADYRKNLRSFLGQTDHLKSCIVLTISMRCPYGDLRCAMCLRDKAYFFIQICNFMELNKIVEPTMPVNSYNDRKVFLRRPNRKGDLDIVRESYTMMVL